MVFNRNQTKNNDEDYIFYITAWYWASCSWVGEEIGVIGEDFMDEVGFKFRLEGIGML